MSLMANSLIPETSAGFTGQSFEFLEQLAVNNTRDWFKAHKDIYEQSLKHPFAELLHDLSIGFEEIGLSLSGSARTMFRIHRDIRFTKNKSPYSTHVSGVLTPSGSKNDHEGLLYLHLDASGGFMATGFYQLSPTALRPIRETFVEQPQRFEQVLQDLSRHGLALEQSDRLKSMPRGFEAHSDHPLADFIRLKSLIVQQPVPKAAWISGEVARLVWTFGQNTESLRQFGQEVLGMEFDG